MGYKSEARKTFIEQTILGFSYELYLLSKYQNKTDITIDGQLHEFLETGIVLSKFEEKRIVKKAIEIANTKYGLSLQY